MTRQQAARAAAYLLLVGVFAGTLWIDHQQDIDRCRDRNQATEDAVRIVVAALIRVGGADADPSQVETFSTDIDEQLAAVRVDCVQ